MQLTSSKSLAQEREELQGVINVVSSSSGGPLEPGRSRSHTTSNLNCSGMKNFNNSLSYNVIDNLNVDNLNYDLQRPSDSQRPKSQAQMDNTINNIENAEFKLNCTNSNLSIGNSTLSMSNGEIFKVSSHSLAGTPTPIVKVSSNLNYCNNPAFLQNQNNISSSLSPSKISSRHHARAAISGSPLKSKKNCTSTPGALKLPSLTGATPVANMNNFHTPTHAGGPRSENFPSVLSLTSQSVNSSNNAGLCSSNTSKFHTPFSTINKCNNKASTPFLQRYKTEPGFDDDEFGDSESNLNHLNDLDATPSTSTQVAQRPVSLMRARELGLGRIKKSQSNMYLTPYNKNF